MSLRYSLLCTTRVSFPVPADRSRFWEKSADKLSFRCDARGALKKFSAIPTLLLMKLSMSVLKTVCNKDELMMRAAIAVFVKVVLFNGNAVESL